MTIRLWYTLAILILISCFSRAAQIPTIRVKTEEVRIDMLVTDHGKPVTDLRETDFEVFDNGVPQKIEFVGFQQTPIDSILVLDMSASVAGETFESLRNAGSRFLDALQKDERAALVTFGDIVSLGSSLSNDIKRVKECSGSCKADRGHLVDRRLLCGANACGIEVQPAAACCLQRRS